VVLAGILTAKGIPNELRLSLDHIWVDYPGKQATALENPGVEFAGREDGRFFLRWPADFELGREISDQLAIYLAPAPAWRALLLVAGFSLLLLWNAGARRLGAGRLARDCLLPLEQEPRMRRARRRVRGAARPACAGPVSTPQRA